MDGTTTHKNSGSFTLGSTHKTQTFQLNFEFDTTGFNGMDTGATAYQLGYNGPATVQWTNQGALYQPLNQQTFYYT